MAGPEIIDELNRQAVDAGTAMDRMCQSVSLPTAKILLDLARELTASPLGTGDGNVIRAQRILEQRLGQGGNYSPNKLIVVEGSAGFQRLIEECL